MTPSTGVGRGRKGIRRPLTSVVDGKKLCKGPLHAEGGEWLPVASFSRRPPKKPGLTTSWVAVCKRCRGHRIAKDKTRGANHGYITISHIKFIFVEIEHRVGRQEMSRLLGWQGGKAKRVLEGTQRYMERHTVAKAMEVLKDLRARDVVRSKRDIRYGSAARGRPETRPVHQRELYRPGGGDGEAEYRREHRRRNAAA